MKQLAHAHLLSFGPNAGACISVLQTLTELAKKAKCWEQCFLGLDGPGVCHCPPNPSPYSPEITELVARGLVQYFESSANPDVPDYAIRIWPDHQPVVELLIELYLGQLTNRQKKISDEQATST